VRSWLVRHGLPLAGLVLLAVLAFQPALQTRPFGTDNLGALSWAASAEALSFLRGHPLLYPEWRPLTYLTIWLQYQLVGLDAIQTWFLVNILLWALSAYAVYACVLALTGSTPSAMLVAVATLVDSRGMEDLGWIEGRQTSMVCIFGLLAFLLALRAASAPRWPSRLALWLLLLASALSKEYGLAFSGAVLVLLLLSRPPDWRALGLSAGLAVGCYLLLRLFFGGSAVTGYCNEMGYFSTDSYVCYRDLDRLELAQRYLYHSVAAFFGTILPGLFSGRGAIRPNLAVLAVSLGWFVFTLAGWLAQPRRTLPLLALVAFVAALSFVVYRDRNLVFGRVGLYLTAGVGLAYLARQGRRTRVGRIALVMLTPLLLWWAVHQALAAQALVQDDARRTLALEGCAKVQEDPRRYDLQVTAELKKRYGLANPWCS
jgi:hypothetical protein